MNNSNINLLRAKCLIEAADILNESNGANGAAKRFYMEKIKSTQTHADKLKRKADQYKRAGYGDMSPSTDYDEAIDRVNSLKGTMSRYYDTTSNPDMERRQDNASRSSNPSGMGDEYEDAFFDSRNRKKKMSEKEQRLHKRINNRSKNEAIDYLYDILTGEDY